MKRMSVIVLLVVSLVLSWTAIGYSLCKVGNKAEVLWKGTWYPATVKKVKGDQCYIHYAGYGNNWDEWVGPDRIKIKGEDNTASASNPADPAPKYSVGDPVQVNWKGSWYPARVIAVGNNKWKIHYDGYDNSWDEWVALRRIRQQ